MPKFTPGPWKLTAGRCFETCNGTFYLSYGRDKYDNPEFKNFCELDQNAHLISAAPSLYSAARDALAFIGGLRSMNFPLIKECDVIKKQLASALTLADGEKRQI